MGKYAPERYPFDLALLNDKDSTLHTFGFLERQIAACCTLDQKDEYSNWISSYFGFLTDSVGDDDSLVDRLSELCQRLLCPSATEKTHSSDILITPAFKRSLLRRELPRLTKNPLLQGL